MNPSSARVLGQVAPIAIEQRTPNTAVRCIALKFLVTIPDIDTVVDGHQCDYNGSALRVSTKWTVEHSVESLLAPLLTNVLQRQRHYRRQ